MANRWRERLKETLDSSGRSMREVSLAAECGPGYIHDILKGGKEPTLDRLLKIARELDVSLSWIVYGLDIGMQEEELLRLFANLSERQRRAFLDLAKSTADNDS